jgi:Tfp pilus assembly protein PilX
MTRKAIQFFDYKSQNGMALPTVMALFMISSVILLAGWRNIALAHGWSRYQAERWQLKQAALDTLTTAAQAVADNHVSNSDSASNAHIAFPTDQSQWVQLQNQLPVNGCSLGICRPLLHLGNRRSDWLDRATQSRSAVTESGLQILYWVEVIPAQQNATPSAKLFVYRITAIAQADQRGSQSGWQAVWQPALLPQPDQAVRLADMHRVLELLP